MISPQNTSPAPVHPNMANDLISFGYSESQRLSDGYELHCHNYYEIYFFLGGDVDYLVEGQQYKPTPNSILLLSPHVFHGVRINSSSLYCRFPIHFHAELLSVERRALLLSVFPSPDRADAPVYYEHVDLCQLPACFQALEDCVGKSEEISRQLVPICMEALLARIVTLADRKDSCSPIHGTSDMISGIIQYLNQHLKEPITLDELSERFFISKHHLNKVFRKATGTTVFDYLLHKRIILAQQLLMDGYSAQDAAVQSGFHDYSAFYRAYTKILGHSPLKDRGGLASLIPPHRMPLTLVDLK